MNELGDAGAAVLATMHLPALETLDLSMNFITHAGAATLAAAAWPNLKSLNLGDNDIGATGAKALSTGNWPGLQKLLLTREFGKGGLGPDGVAALAGANWPALEVLDLAVINVSTDDERGLHAAFPRAELCLEEVESGDDEIDYDIKGYEGWEELDEEYMYYLR